jgi:hypothetical protein
MDVNRNLSTFITIILVFFILTCIIPFAAAEKDNSNAGGNSDNSNAGGNSDNSNAGGNSDNSNAGGNSDNSNAGGNSDNSNAGGNSDNSNAGGNSDNSNTEGNSRSSNLGISGSQNSVKDNTREITVNLQQAERAGEKISVGEKEITVTKGKVTITITTAASIKGENGQTTAVVRSISLEHHPVTTHFEDTGTVSAAFRADLLSLPQEDSAITAEITKKPDPLELAGFNRAAADTGYQLDAVAYTMDVAKTRLEDGKDIGQATVTMTVSPSWIEEHGGATVVRIARLADDGTSQILKTHYRGIDSSSNYIFEGDSPGGLSIFALITIREPITPVQTPQTVINVKSQPEQPATGSVPFMGLINPFALTLPLVFLGLLLIFRRRLS